MEKPENKKIQFKPLHDGMGFHPFSDGLPYAPESKNKYSTGSGAVSAGRPTFANPNSATQKPLPKPTPKASVTATSVNTAGKPLGTARQLQAQQNFAHGAGATHAQAGTAALTSPQVAFHVRKAQVISNTAIAPQMARVQAAMKAETALANKISTTEQADLEKQILRHRVFAYLMDTLIHAGFWITTNLAALFFFKFQIDSEILKDNFFQFVSFFSVSQWMFIALQESLFGNSLGKVFFRLEFKRNHQNLFLRSIVFMIGLYCFGLGLIFRPQDKLGKIQMKSKLEPHSTP